ncbi:hypothetical protein [Bacillus sp. Marseille-Q1617]|uniref:hypothetical protein n=1 Tax=Bacillus sp. Marseille-Q1617 TaxID=2736887 RepID=UPI00158D0C77|nr:hypothetical protein [Bacillus sp. Marseille-Q1617]
MKKSLTSIIGGVIIGLIISFFTLEYDGWKFVQHNSDGEVYQVLNEIDVNHITNSFLIIVGSGVAIYISLTLFEKFLGNNQKT